MMLIRKSDGSPTPEWKRYGPGLGEVKRFRPHYAPSPQATKRYDGGLEAYVGKPYRVIGLVWTVVPFPFPYIAVEFEDGAQALLTVISCVQGWRGIFAEIEDARKRTGCMEGLPRLPVRIRA